MYNTPFITAEMLLHGYTQGVFIMANPDENNELYWVEPEMRGIIPINQFKVSKSLKQSINSNKYTCTINTRFEAVLRGCANREETWISEEIILLYKQLHQMGYAYSFEIWYNNELAGGLYGVALGKAFFGESMFSLKRDASKLALYHLVEWMKKNGFTLLDTQYITPHLQSLGAIEINQELYLELLHDALS